MKRKFQKKKIQPCALDPCYALLLQYEKNIRNHRAEEGGGEGLTRCF